MKIVNFNRRDKSSGSGLLNTFIDWNKQYCYDLNRKVTSLYNYMIWNYPEYLIFNAPTSLSGNDDFEPYKSLVDKSVEPRLVQPYEQHVTIQLDADNSEIRSVFFPSRLNYHQGFYNQSDYGDAFLLCWKDDCWRTIHQEDYLSPIYYLFNSSGDTATIDDRISFYQCYVNTKNKTQAKQVRSTPGKNSISFTIGTGLDHSKIKTSISPNTQISDIKTNYNGLSTGTFEVSWTYRGMRSTMHKIVITYEASQNEWQLVSASSLFSQDNHTIIYNGQDEAILLHKTRQVSFGNTWLLYNSETNTLEKKLVIEKDVVTMSYDTENKTYQKNIKEAGDYTFTDKIDLSNYMNFPSGYICILNKQPSGLNNEQNPIKNNLSNYLVAPIGNGGYYDIWWNNNDLQADYKANELNNFSNKISINLAQNCRYVNPSPNTFSFDNNDLNITISNWHIDGTKITTPQLTDKYKNIWTGQDDLIAQTYLGGEKIFADVQYNNYRSVVKQQNVHNLNAHVDSPFSLSRVDLLIY